MVSRMVVNLAIMCILRQCWVVEQPASSLLEHHGLFVWLCKNFRVFKAPWAIVLGSSNPQFSGFKLVYATTFSISPQPVASHQGLCVDGFVWWIQPLNCIRINCGESVQESFQKHLNQQFDNSLAPSIKHITVKPLSDQVQNQHCCTATMIGSASSTSHSRRTRSKMLMLKYPESSVVPLKHVNVLEWDHGTQLL